MPEKRLENSMTFVASSKQMFAERVEREHVDIDQILLRSETFQRAFPNVCEKPGERAVRDPGSRIIQHSVKSEGKTLPASWGLVSTILEAYNGHHELVLRPDDVWQAILTQFSFYINNNAEKLRDRFVDFSGKKQLVIVTSGTLFTADFGSFACRMVDEKIMPNIRDPEVAQWLMPNFSTTTTNDRIAASVTVMATLQAYFEYVCRLLCGIPKVTLLGSKEDWRQLRKKCDGLKTYDLEDQLMSKWHGLLAPVLNEFVNSADGCADTQFWDCICHRRGGGSGPSHLSGWVTVFAVFTAKGLWQGQVPECDTWPCIDTANMPVGAVAVPVIVDDNGTNYECTMIVGQVAHEVVGESESSLKPRTDWCIAFKGVPEDPRES